MGNKKSAQLSLFGFFAITAAMVMSVHEYPTFAVAGMQIPFFLVATGLLWFLPVALCSAEMATVKDWEEGGGIYTWVSNMLGERFGFAAVFFQWLQITVCFVTIIYFMLGALSYLLDVPEIENNPFIKCMCVLAIYWVLSFVQLGGMKKTAFFARFGFIFGVAVPTVMLLVFGIIYVAQGKPLELGTEPTSFFPDFAQASTLVVFVSFLFANMGTEASASHVNEMKNPKRDYPLAMFLLVVLATVLNAIGGFTVAGVVSLSELSMSSGIVQTFEGLILGFDSELVWLVKIVCALLVIGVIGEVGSWIVGPSRALYITTERGLLPRHLLGLNTNNVPTRIILVQAIVVSVWTVILTLGGGGNNLSFLAAISLTTIIYLVNYLMMFLSYIKLIRRPDLHRDFHVPGGMVGKVVLPVSGLLSSAFALVIAFFPPMVLGADQAPTYEVILAVSFTLALTLPFAIYELYGKRHERKPITPMRMKANEVNKFTRLSGRSEHLIGTERKRSSPDCFTAEKR